MQGRIIGGMIDEILILLNLGNGYIRVCFTIFPYLGWVEKFLKA